MAPRSPDCLARICTAKPGTRPSEPYAEGAVEGALTRHRAAVVSRAGAAPKDPTIATKYEWLISYSNWACSNFFDVPDARIDSDQSRRDFQLLVPRP